jgi:hypothetical protein
MGIRRVVTGTDPAGRPAIVSDGPAPRAHDFVHVPGMSSTMLWATEPDEPLRLDGSDPTRAVVRHVPGPGATRFVIVRFPPDSVVAAPGFDVEAADAEHRLVSPGLAELFEPDHPGMHQTDTVDYAIVVEGEIWLDLDEGGLTRLGTGDVCVQNGTRHAWRNRGSAGAVVAFVNVGQARPDTGA